MKSQPPPSTRWQAITAAAFVIIASFWFWPTPKVELSSDGYDVTIALYRVCNQQSTKGLDRIKAELAEMKHANGDEDASFLAISKIVQQANRGEWKNASVACRQALEDQVGGR